MATRAEILAFLKDSIVLTGSAGDGKGEEPPVTGRKARRLTTSPRVVANSLASEGGTSSPAPEGIR